MGRQKSSPARVFSLRLNPATSTEDAELLRIILDAKARGVDFKQLVRPALLRQSGIDPASFTARDPLRRILAAIEARPTPAFREDTIARLVADAVREALRGVQFAGPGARGGGETDDDNEITPPAKVSAFSRNLAAAIMQRNVNG